MTTARFSKGDALGGCPEVIKGTWEVMIILIRWLLLALVSPANSI